MVPEEDLKGLMKQLGEVNSESDVNIQEFFNREALRLTYENGILMDFFAVATVSNLHFKGIPIFSSDPLYLVVQMVSILSENPIAKKEELVFPKSHIFLFDFLNEDETRAANKEKSISWRNSLRVLSVSLDDYKELDIFNN